MLEIKKYFLPVLSVVLLAGTILQYGRRELFLISRIFVFVVVAVLFSERARNLFKCRIYLGFMRFFATVLCIPSPFEKIGLGFSFSSDPAFSTVYLGDLWFDRILYVYLPIFTINLKGDFTIATLIFLRRCIYREIK